MRGGGSSAAQELDSLRRLPLTHFEEGIVDMSAGGIGMMDSTENKDSRATLTTRTNVTCCFVVDRVWLTVYVVQILSRFV